MAFFVYILKCIDKSYYVGHTENIEERIAAHNSGEIRCFTTKRLPVDLVFIQEFSTRSEALDAERQLKKWNRYKKEALIEKNWEKIRVLAKKRFQ